MNRITIDDDVEARVRAAFDEMIPKLIDSASATTLDRRIADDHDPLIVLGQPQRSRARLAAAVFATAAAIVGLLAITNRPSLDAPAAAPAPTPSSAANSWFDVLRPLIPERFGYLALVDSSESSARFVALDQGAWQVDRDRSRSSVRERPRCIGRRRRNRCLERDTAGLGGDHTRGDAN